ncbi:MAG: class I SAM-dependent methyltransferase [Anaerolineales bacterium]
MPDTVEICPLCGVNTSSLFDQRVFRDHPVSNRICHHCGLVYQSPRMTASESQVFYESEYRRLYQGQEGPNAKDLAVQAARAQITLDFVCKWVKSSPYILDIGCSSGVLLQQLQAYYQAQAFGVEPGTVYRNYAQSSGLVVYPSLEELEQEKVPHFNLISMMHVLEHLPDPVHYLRHLRENLLEQDGWLLVEVPNLYAHDCFEVAHLISFSAHSLSQVIQKAGFRPIQLRSHGQPRSRLIPLYLTLLAQPDSNPVYSFKPDRYVRIKRQIGFLQRRLVERLLPQRAWLSPGTNIV